MKRTLLILLISILSLSLEGLLFQEEYEMDFKQKVNYFLKFIKNTDLSNMYNYIYSKNRWCAAVDLISDLVSDYSGNEDDEDDEDEEDIDEYSNNFCKDPCLKLTKVSFESCKYFIKEFYYCIRDFPYCHGGKIPI